MDWFTDWLQGAIEKLAGWLEQSEPGKGADNG